METNEPWFNRQVVVLLSELDINIFFLPARSYCAWPLLERKGGVPTARLSGERAGFPLVGRR